jgi:hypothetical protein
MPLPRLAAYTLALCPVPGTSVAFGIGSIVHFANDIGFFGSVSLHAVLCVLAAVNARLACVVLQCYMCMLHIPSVLISLALRRQWTAIVCTAAAAAVAWVARAKLAPKGEFVLGEVSQRVVVVHTVLQVTSSE